MSQISFVAEIVKELALLNDKLDRRNPDTKSNSGRLLGRALFWDTIKSYADKQSKLAWGVLEKEEIIDKSGLTPGKHTLAESPAFVCIANVSQPYKSFSADVLAEALKKKYRVPTPIAKEMIEAAKIPGNSRTTLDIVER